MVKHDVTGVDHANNNSNRQNVPIKRDHWVTSAEKETPRIENNKPQNTELQKYHLHAIREVECSRTYSSSAISFSVAPDLISKSPRDPSSSRSSPFSS